MWVKIYQLFDFIILLVYCEIIKIWLQTLNCDKVQKKKKTLNCEIYFILSDNCEILKRQTANMAKRGYDGKVSEE